MGEFNVGEKVAENPFIFYEEEELINQGMERLAPPSPHKAIYEKLAPLLLRSPPAKRYPQEPSGTKGWDVLIDPMGALMPTSAVPDPIIGLTTQRTMRPTVTGKEGLATHLNIVVDVSGSMGGPENNGGTCYGYAPSGFGMSGEDIAIVCCAMMISQAALSGDSFAIYSFSRDAKVVWAGPSQDYSGALEYILGSYSPNDDTRPFKVGGGTKINKALNLVGTTLEGYDFDQCVTVLITDGSFSSVSVVDSQIFDSAFQYNDEQIRRMGPLFYVVLGSPFTKEKSKASVLSFQESLKTHYKRSMNGCVMAFDVVVGEDGNFTEFAGTLVDMARVNSGDSEIAECPRVD